MRRLRGESPLQPLGNPCLYIISQHRSPPARCSHNFLRFPKQKLKSVFFSTTISICVFLKKSYFLFLQTTIPIIPFQKTTLIVFLKGKQRGRSEGLRITWRGDAASLEGNRRKYVRNKTEKRFRSFLNDNQIFDFLKNNGN